MRTGFGDDGGHQEDAYINGMIGIMLPVMEKSMILAGQYARACGRDTIVSDDMQYAMKYCAMHTVGRDIGSMYPEIYTQDEDEDEDEDDEVDEDTCPPFTRYMGTDPHFLAVNDAYDQWGAWVPEIPAERMLKNAIDSNEYV